MSQQSPASNNERPTPPKTGVTAVLDSMIRSTDERERVADRPLAAARPNPAPPISSSIDVRDITMSAPRPPSMPPQSTRSDQTARVVAGSVALPAPATRISFSQFSNMGRPLWSVAGATALGLPSRFLESFDSLTDGDEAAWISTFVKLTAPMCSGANDNPAILVASDPAGLPTALGLPLYEPAALPPYGGSIFAKLENTDSDFAWLERIRGDRDLHLVLGGSDTDWLTCGEPTAVSYTSHRGALEALSMAEATGAAIAFGINAEGTPIRATALELTLSIRSLFRIR